MKATQTEDTDRLYSINAEVVVPLRDPRLKMRYGDYLARIEAEVAAGADAADDDAPDRFGWEQFALFGGRFHCARCDQSVANWEYFTRHLSQQHGVEFLHGVPADWSEPDNDDLSVF